MPEQLKVWLYGLIVIGLVGGTLACVGSVIEKVWG